MSEDNKVSLYDSFNKKIKESTKERIKKQIFASIHQHIRVAHGDSTADAVLQLLNNGILELTDYSGILSGLEKSIITSRISPVVHFKNVQDYLANYIYTIQLKNYIGIEELSATQIFITLAVLMQDLELSTIETMLKQLALTYLCIAGQTNLEIRILDNVLLAPLCQALKFESVTYYTICNKFIEILCTTIKALKVQSKIPTICYVYGVFSKRLNSLTKKLAENLKLPITKVETELSCIDIENKAELQVCLEKLCQNNKETSFEELYKNFEKVYSTEYLMEIDCQEKLISNKVIPIIPKYLYAEYFKINLFKAVASVTIDFNKINMDNINEILGYAETLLTTMKGKETVKIILKNTPVLSLGAMKKLNKTINIIQNTYSSHVFFEIFFNPSYNRNMKQNSFDKIYVLSDVHVDYNEGHLPILTSKGKFILNGGDTSGSAEKTIDWIKKSIDAGIFVHGNHLGYGERAPIEDQIEALKEAFPIDGDVSYLNNAYKEYNGVIFIGACLYTDFTVYGKSNVGFYKRQANYGMNDFRYPRTKNDNFIRTLTPEDYVKWYNESVKYIYETTEKFKDMPVVILTHFAPLPFSIHSKYERSPLNAAFANDLRYLIDERPNITHWIHGHTHDSFNYIYNNTRIICSPYGYYHEGNTKTKQGKEKNYPEVFFTFEEIKSGKLPEKLRKYTFSNWKTED